MQRELTQDELVMVVGSADIDRLLGQCGCGKGYCYAHSVRATV